MTDRYKEAIQGARDCVERNKDGGVYLPDLLRVIDSQQAEIERLQQELRTKNGAMLEIFENKSVWERLARIKAIKEFAERLKEKAETETYTDYCPSGNSYQYEYRLVDVDDIDNLVKEMVGEEK